MAATTPRTRRRAASTAAGGQAGAEAASGLASKWKNAAKPAAAQQPPQRMAHRSRDPGACKLQGSQGAVKPSCTGGTAARSPVEQEEQAMPPMASFTASVLAAAGGTVTQAAACQTARLAAGSIPRRCGWPGQRLLAKASVLVRPRTLPTARMRQAPIHPTTACCMDRSFPANQAIHCNDH